MISHKHKFIFVHINKCAGTSIDFVLKKYCERFMKHQVLDGKFENRPSLISQCKYPMEEYFKFTFVRNPWDKELSDYYHNKYRCKRNVGNNFNEYLKSAVFDQPIWHDPQLNWISDKKNNILTDFIGRFENLQQDFNTICDKIKIPQQKLTHELKSKHKHYTEYYDEETKSIVAEKYAKDIEYFGYEFGE
jgi:hypothetical protein